MRATLTTLWPALPILASGCQSPPAPPVATPHAPPGATAPADAWPPLPDPTIWNAASGQLTLTAGPATVSFNGQTYPTNLYNGLYVPPVIQVNPGGTISLTFNNQMDTAAARPHELLLSRRAGRRGLAARPAPAPMGGQSFTNIHYHGFNVSPNSPGDNPFLMVYPQGSGSQPTSYNYTVNLPTWHAEGLYWYHPHPHGISEPQVLGGMSGCMIVGDILKDFYPSLVGITQHVMLLKDFTASTDPNAPLLKTINGQPQSTITIAPNELQFWRFANVGADAFFDMQLQTTSGAPISAAVIAIDGNPTTQPLPMSHLFLAAGARMEVVVSGPPAGTYNLVSLAIDTGPQGDPNPQVTLAQVVSSGTARPNATDLSALRPVKTDPQTAELAKRRATAATYPQRTFTFSETTDGDTFFINGKEYDPSRVDTTIQFPTVEEWTILNTSGELHVFHIHQLDFLVEEVNGQSVPNNGVQDTITIPYMTKGTPGKVKILVPFTNPEMVGMFVYHCHILGHEDAGMMANICVQRTPADCNLTHAMHGK